MEVLFASATSFWENEAGFGLAMGECWCLSAWIESEQEIEGHFFRIEHIMGHEVMPVKCQKNFCYKNKGKVKKIGKIMLCASVSVVLIVTLPHAVWFVLLAILMLVLGIQLFKG